MGVTNLEMRERERERDVLTYFACEVCGAKVGNGAFLKQELCSLRCTDLSCLA